MTSSIPSLPACHSRPTPEAPRPGSCWPLGPGSLPALSLPQPLQVMTACQPWSRPGSLPARERPTVNGRLYFLHQAGSADHSKPGAPRKVPEAGFAAEGVSSDAVSMKAASPGLLVGENKGWLYPSPSRLGGACGEWKVSRSGLVAWPPGAGTFHKVAFQGLPSAGPWQPGQLPRTERALSLMGRKT